MSSCSNPKAGLHRRQSSFASSSRANPKVQPLPREYFSHLIKLESDFQSNSYTVEILDELVQLYARAVEYYDSIQDQISSYFTYKIQDVLATKKSLKMLIERKQSEKREQKGDLQGSSALMPRDTNKMGEKYRKSGKKSLGEESSDEESEKSRRENWEKKKETKEKASRSLAALKSQKQRFAQFYHRVETEKNNYQQDMHVVFSNYTNSTSENDQVVQKAIRGQKQRIKERIEQRKNQSFMAYTLNSTISVSSTSPRSLARQEGEENFDVGGSNRVFSDALTPLLKKNIKNLMKKEQNSESKSNIDTGIAKEEEGGQAKAGVWSTPTTENSLSLNEVAGNSSEIEIASGEALKLV